MTRLLTVIRESVRMAVADGLGHPLRSALSMAGFAIGIVIAVVLVGLGEGLLGAVTGILRGMGEGQIVIVPGRTTGVGGERRGGRPVRLRYEDIEEVVATPDAFPSFQGLAAYFDLRGGGASSSRYSIPWSPIRAVDHAYLDVRGLPITEGRWFTEVESIEGQWVAVLNEPLAKVVFPDGGAVGEWIEWRGRRMTVVGVVKDDSIFPYMVFLPYPTVTQLADARYITGLIARPMPQEPWARAIGELRRVLGGIGGFDPGDATALEIEDNSAFTEKVATATTALQALVATIAAVSVLLGGLGVANMMVITVTERTAEIGLRKALGATPRVIFLQVFCEALAIVSAGGLVGAALGAAACLAIGSVPISPQHSAEIRFHPVALALSLLGLALIAFISGLLPARKAAALPAAEALRWE